MRIELQEMTDVLLGREQPPIDAGILTLMEVAEAYHARAREMEMQLHEAESDGHVLKDSKHYRFRTGQLRSFIELSKRAMELGSRRLTAAQVEAQLQE